jgi:RNA polymerase sigma-70 factor (ECF subfamily)
MLMAIDREQELTRLIRMHQRGVWRYLRYLGAENSEADDLTQETFLTVWRNPFDDYDDRATAAYLRQVAKNKFLMLVRARRRKPEVADLAVAENEFAAFARDDGGDAHIEALADCIKGLRGKAKQVVEYYHLQGNSRAATATLMQMTEEGVKSLLKRVKDSLRECVERKTK